MFLILWVAILVLILAFFLSLVVVVGLGGQIADNLTKKREIKPLIEPYVAETETKREGENAKVKRYFLKLGAGQKVEIQESEVKDAKQKGYEILIE